MNDARVQAAFARVRREAGDGRLADLYRKRADDLRASLFAPQRALIDDPHRFKAALCTRRAGKSTVAIRGMLIVALETPNANVQYIALSGKKARKEIWPDLKRTARNYGLVEADDKPFNEMTCTMRLANGSTINLDGCDTVGEVEKYRGSDGGYDLVVIDEAKSYAAGMFAELVYEAIMPALGDREGTLLIIGTPGRSLAGPFYDITAPRAMSIGTRRDQDATGATGEPYSYAMSRPYAHREDATWQGVTYEWSFHRWYTRDNTAKPGIWLDQQATKRRVGWTDEDPVWRREYCGEWVADDRGYVYRYLAERNEWVPDGTGDYGLSADHEWHYVMGCDLGYDDDFAIVVAAWSETCPQFYFIDEFSKPGLMPHQWAEQIKLMIERYGTFDVMVGDRGALGKAILLEMDELYGLTIEAAEKHEKRDYQELLNSDLMSGRALVKKGAQLGVQMSTLQWKPDGKTEDKDSSPKDLTDSALYIWRYCYHNYSKSKPKPLELESSAYVRARADEHRDRLNRELQRKARLDGDEQLAESRQMDGWGDNRNYDGDGEWHS